MATVTLTTVDAWIPEVWAVKATSTYQSNVAARGLCSNTYQAFARGTDLIRVPHTQTETTAALTSDLTLTFTAATERVNTIAPTIRRAWAKKVDILADITTNVGLLTLYSEAAGKKLALDFDNDMQDAMDGATAHGTDNVDITDSVILAAQKAMNDDKIPQSNRWLLVTPGTVQAFRSEEKYQNSLYAASSGGQKGQMSENGYMGRIYEFEVYMTQQPLSGTAGKKSFMGHKSAVEYVEVKPITFEAPRLPHDALAHALIAWTAYGRTLFNYNTTASPIYACRELAGT